MSTTTAKLYSLKLTEIRTYLFTGLFIIGNLLLPQLAHLIPQGGLIFLPIYFFTLIAAYKYGIHVGLLTAILSPILNSFIFGMPLPVMLPAILTKSVLLAIAASLAAKHFGKVSFGIILLVILTYQLLGTAAEWIYTQNFTTAIQDIRIGFPGMLLQLIGGFLILKKMEKA